jgi:hypothetical protein
MVTFERPANRPLTSFLLRSESALPALAVRRPSARFSNRRLLLFLANLLAIPFASQRFFHALFLARLQIEGMTLHFLDDVFGLHFALETAQRILKGLAFLYSNFCQD